MTQAQDLVALMRIQESLALKLSYPPSKGVLAMEIFALYGPSGTGKSTSALNVAHKYQIPAIIDDGLFIYHGRKIAGHSAKYEKTTIQAVKRAIFFWQEHAEEVKNALKTHPVERLLILGTSQKMIHRIVQALDLPSVDHYIKISDIRTSSEIKAALFDREMQGRHVIPIPRLQVEQDFIQRLIAKVDQIFSPKKEMIGETTIVHPQFQTGKIHVNEAVFKKIVSVSCQNLPTCPDFRKIKVDLTNGPSVSLEIALQVTRQQRIPAIIQQIQKRIYSSYLDHLNLELRTIDVVVSQIHFQLP
jgi:hypothetical protein